MSRILASGITLWGPLVFLLSLSTGSKLSEAVKHTKVAQASSTTKKQECTYNVVESIPDGLEFEQKLNIEILKTHEVLIEMINNATETIKVASFYTTLLACDEKHSQHETSIPGRMILEALIRASRDRKVKVEIVVGVEWSVDDEQNKLIEAGVVYKYLNMKKLLGDGVQHAKFIITDGVHLMIGSANWDWRSMTQVKELHILYKDCPILAQDLTKIHETYLYLVDQPKIPESIPEHLLTDITMQSPASIQMDGVDTQVYLSAGPAQLEGTSPIKRRTTEIEAILNIIASAQNFIYISVADYNLIDYGERKYWPVIDDALRAAFYERHVEVKFIVTSKGKAIRPDLLTMYKSLNAVKNSRSRGGIDVKVFTVPVQDDFQASIPFSRMNHDKFVVTEKTVFISTSNWSKNYFTNTCGVGISISPNTEQISVQDNIINKMKAIFNRDFLSKYADSVDNM